MKTSPGIWAARGLVAFLIVVVAGFGVNHLYVDDAFVPELNWSVLMPTVVICAGLVYAMYRLWKFPDRLDRAITTQEKPNTRLVYIQRGFWQLMRYSLTVGFFRGLVLGGGIALFFTLGPLIEGLFHYEIAGICFFGQIEGIGLIIGMLAGAVFGAFNGLLIAWLTWQFFLPPKDASGYQGTVGWACASLSLLLLIGIAVIMFVFYDFFHSHGVMFPIPLAAPFIPFIAWSASQKVCCWYTSEGNTMTREVISDNSL